ncbi:hypothetical protein ONZ45_g19430 [Pleurotus djamor]|nr:hypothetical protein ONZ45_g19430 [Pleurotus djamor]
MAVFKNGSRAFILATIRLFLLPKTQLSRWAIMNFVCSAPSDTAHGPLLFVKSDFTDNDFAEELLAANSHLKDLGLDRTVILRNIAIGHWDDDGDGIYQTIGDRIVVPTGRNVQVHIVDDPSSSGAHFSRIFCAETRLCIKEHASLYCNAYGEDSACFAMHESCYHYLRSWVEPHLLPPRTRIANPPLTFGEELYEIFNSRTEIRKFYKGYLPCIDYGISAAGMEDQYRDYFSHVRRKGSQRIAQAISAGLRGYELIPAIKLDFRVWTYMSPDTFVF